MEPAHELLRAGLERLAHQEDVRLLVQDVGIEGDSAHVDYRVGAATAGPIWNRGWRPLHVSTRGGRLSPAQQPVRRASSQTGSGRPRDEPARHVRWWRADAMAARLLAMRLPPSSGRRSWPRLAGRAPPAYPNAQQPGRMGGLVLDARLTRGPQPTILAPMLGRTRRTAAVFLLGAAVSPWLSSGTVALHIGRHAGHRHDGHEREASAAALHGHHHEVGTPDHQHLLTLPVAAPAPAKAVFAPLPAALARIIALAACESAGALTGFGGGAPDPPSARRSPSILRI